MKNLVIVGAGEFGQELYSWCLSEEGKDWKIKGFLDDNSACLSHGKVQHRILSDVASYIPEESDVFLCAVGTGAVRIKLAKMIQEKGGQFINFMHPAAIVCQHFSMGVGNILGPFVYAGIYAQIGDFNFFNVSSSIGHHVQVGHGCTVNSHADITGNVILEDCVLLGSHACIIPSKRVGEGAIVGAGSAVMRNVPPGVTVIGVPAKKLM